MLDPSNESFCSQKFYNYIFYKFNNPHQVVDSEIKYNIGAIKSLTSPTKELALISKIRLV